jgi:hypothetical protein
LAEKTKKSAMTARFPNAQSVVFGIQTACDILGFVRKSFAVCRQPPERSDEGGWRPSLYMR